MAPSPSATHEPADRARQALVVIDMLSGWDFPEADALLRQTLKVAPHIARLAARCRAAGVPVIYANDNRGRWRSDLQQVVKAALADDGRAPTPGERITRALEPRAEDYFVLKPRHSAFYATPLALLLADLGVRELLLAGVSSDQCVLATAQDARMRGLDIVVPRDCVASLTAARTRRSLQHFDEVLRVPTTASPRLRLSRA